MIHARVKPLHPAAIAALLASTVLTTPALAQVEEAAAAGNEEIIVTATKREESLQKVPISLQALGNATLDQHQVKSFDDYAKLLPSVSYQTYGPGQSDISFRGVATGGINLPGGSLPTAGVYLDEIPVTTIGAMLDVHAYDFARVEALSGPQGTLFGASSLAGTLRLITNKPNTSKFEGGYDLQLNKFGKGNVGGVAEGFVNLPLSETVAVRAVGFYQKDGGYIDNTLATRVYTLSDADPSNDLTVNNAAFVKKDFNTVETYGGRVALGIDLDDNWTATPTIIAQHQLAKGTFGIDPRAGDLDVHEFAPDRNLDKWYQAALTIKGTLSDFDVVYSGGYFQRSIDNQQDYSYYTVYYDNIPGYTNFPDGNGGFLDPTQSYANTQRMTKHTHELRVSSPAEKPFRFTTGMFFQRQSNHNIAHYFVPGLAATGYTTVFGDDIFLTDTHITTRDYAVFGEANLDIVPGVILTAGIRGFMAKNSLYGFSGFPSNTDPGGVAQEVGAPPGSGCTLPLTLGKCYNVNKTYQQSGETHKANLTWQIDPDRMVYVTYSTGFRPGGNNRRPGIDPYEADTIDNFEFGWKTSWFDRTLRLNGAVFYQKWNKLQYTLAPEGTVGVVNIYNAGDARIYGAELDAQVRAGGLTLSAAGSYTDAKLSTDFCAIGTDGNQLPSCSLATNDVAAPKGTRLPVQPKFKVTGTARYDFELGAHDTFVQGSLLHQSGVRNFLGLDDNGAVGNTKGFTTFDFSAGVKFAGLSFEAFIQNAFDKRGILSRNTFCAPVYCGVNARSYPVKPQLFGLKVAQRF
jgi:iron complex outermembrane recepter protein